MTALLSGLRVVDLGQYIAAPGAGQNLADLGADVVKVEGLDGDQARSVGAFGEAMVRANNRGKRSLALDLKHPDGATVLRDLISSADVLIHNFRHGAAERLGFGAEETTRGYPMLVYGFVSGFGTAGPSADRAGLDIAAQAEFGVMHGTGAVDGDPQRVGFAVADAFAAQALTAGVLSALLRRSTTGRGGIVETSLMEALVHAQSSSWAEYTLTGTSPRRRGNGQALAAPAADLVHTRDGSIVVSAYTPSKFAALCDVIDRPELAHDERFHTNEARVAHREGLLTVLNQVFRQMSRQEAIGLLGTAGIVCGSVRSFDEIADDKDLDASELLVDVDDSAAPGQYAVPGLPFRLDGDRTSQHLPAPQVGQHTAEILRGLGRTEAEIHALISNRVVVVPRPAPADDQNTAHPLVPTEAPR